MNKFDLNNFNYMFIKIEEKYNIYFFLKITFVLMYKIQYTIIEV